MERRQSHPADLDAELTAAMDEDDAVPLCVCIISEPATGWKG